MESPELKLCVDCAMFEPPEPYDRYAEQYLGSCLRKCLFATNPVDGHRVMLGKRLNCEKERGQTPAPTFWRPKPEERCGPQAVFFVKQSKRPTPPPSKNA